MRCPLCRGLTQRRPTAAPGERIVALERHAERADKKARGLQLQLEQVESTWSGESASQLQADELRTLRCALEDALARVRQEEAARRKRAASVKGFTDSKVSSYGARAQREARQNKRRLRQNVLAQVRAQARYSKNLELRGCR